MATKTGAFVLGFLHIAMCVACAAGPDPVPIQLDVDWPSFLDRHNMTWTRLPRGWTEAPHFGNASLGSMLYQQGDAVALQLFHADVNDHRDNTHGWTAYSRPRFGIGTLHLEPVGTVTGGQLELDLWNAELKGTVRTDRGEIKVRHFVHAEDMVAVTELQVSEGEVACRWTWHPVKAETTRAGYPRKEEEIEQFAARYGDQYRTTLKVYEPNPEGQPRRVEGIEVWRQDLRYGGQYATAYAETGVGGRQRTLYVSVDHSYPDATAAEEAVENVRAAKEASLDALVKTHRAWWHRYYPRSFVSVPDARLESLYWQTIYRYGCTAREGRALVNTSGLWFQGGQWPYITTDYNIQASHWALPAANRMEQSGEVLEALHRARETLSRNVRPEAWQEDSAYLHLTVAPDMIGPRDQDRRYWNSVGCLPWTLHNAWWQYRFSMDDDMLREKLFPLLRRSTNLYLHMLREDGGRLRLPPTFSPEAGTFADCNFDLALLKWSCQTLLWSCARLGVEDPLAPRWEEVLARSVDYPADEYGFKLGRDAAAPTGHRHGSHLMMIYPLHLVNVDRPDTEQVLNASVERFWATPGLPAMVMTHAVPAAAAIGRSDLALKGLRKQADDLLPNGMWHGPPCLEASLSMANGLQTMLIQSWGDTIRVFPAMPDEWKDVAFHDLRAEGAFLVSAVRRDGRTRFVRIRSLAGEPCRLKTDLARPVRVAGAEVDVRPLGGQVFSIGLGKGQEIVLAEENDACELKVRPIHD